MAGFMDMIREENEMESGSSYQKTVIREIARKLMELEEQNDQNAMAIEEVKKLQKTVLQKLDSLNAENEAHEPAAREGAAGVEELQKQVRALTLQLQSSVESINGRLQENAASLDGKLQSVVDKMEEAPEAAPADGAGEDILDRLDTIKLSLEDTIHKENIKCFRNVQGALEEQGDGKAYDMSALRKYLKVIIWFQLIIIAILVLRILGLL